VTLATDGLATFARERGFAGPDGFAQELLMVVGGGYLNDGFLEFFSKLAVVYADAKELLEWHEPIRLSSAIPGSAGMRYLLPAPTAVFEWGSLWSSGWRHSTTRWNGWTLRTGTCGGRRLPCADPPAAGKFAFRFPRCRIWA
jgi:hypothetical protein